MAKQYFIILDANDHSQKIEEGLGVIEGAKLTFKRGALLGMIGGSPQELEFDRKKLIPSKKRLIAYYELDSAGNITQISTKDVSDVSVAAEFNLLYELGKSIEESGLKKPLTTRELLEWLVIGVLLVVFIGGLYQGDQLGSYRGGFINAVNISSNKAATAGFLAANVCTLAIKEGSLFAQYVNASNAALRSTP